MIDIRVPALVLGLALALGGCASGGVPAAPSVRPGPSPAPWMATLAAPGPEPLVRRASCGGALVAPDTVLTAAHCVADLPPEPVSALEVHIGATTLSSDPGRTARIASVATAPGYRILPSPIAPQRHELSSATHDLAVVTLDAPVTGAPPLRLATDPPAAGETATLYGHGITSQDSGTTDALKAIPYRIAPVADCVPETPAPVDTSTMVCARGTPGVACFGDSGGPLVRRAPDGRDELVGVMSFGMETADQPCGTPGPNFFTGLTADRAWLGPRVG